MAILGQCEPCYIKINPELFFVTSRENLFEKQSKYFKKNVNF